VRFGRAVERFNADAAIEGDARQDRDAIADKQVERALAPAGRLGRIGEVPDPSGDAVEQLADAPAEHGLHARAAAVQIDAGDQVVRAGRAVDARAERPGAIGADARIEQRRDRAVAQTLGEDERRRDEIGGPVRHGVRAEDAHAAAVRQLMLPCGLQMQPDRLLPGRQVVEGDMVRDGIAGPLSPGDHAELVAGAWRGGDVHERRRKTAGERVVAVAL
jgi:hypothetical protein